MCLAASPIGAVLEVSYTSTEMAVSGRADSSWIGGEKYSTPAYLALSR